jgi:quercetin dioxygenase-like cupin family protein
MNNIDKLKKLTEDLPAVPKLKELIKSTNPSNCTVNYQVENGTSFGLCLLSRSEVAVMELFVSKGTGWPVHIHSEEKEWGILYRGKLKVTIDGKDRVLGPGDCVFFDKEVAHSSHAVEDTWLIATSIPRIDGYPK